MRKLVRTAKAMADIESIWLYLNTRTPRAADSFSDALERTETQLAQFPQMGTALPHLGAQTRCHPVIFHYVAFTRVEGDILYLLRILHTRRDVTRQWIG